ncbi:hypothetical protein AMIS_46490 [Actinoplanes missouriensis 431]|uniref:Integral membrane protein n=1 Tax=Actinoplanes missouriensis (strain ATCC 14538 / DSM 43046 / CBS 188.64 / JCM 3121 / NBRC 102363 / NCIMB 12654 / NRRL B-3342 / UNCC 431) TaxID=512565 RepID=I0HA32_ACTM4|nr:hypothetical protein [Actinoplanes missouriensis]BAL89869.1 hypothetical protein AMIS_46490 [Actinoplanes missouriensis 431]
MTDNGHGAFRRPGWRKPTPLSYGQALESASMVAAPLLAGFSIAFLGVVGADADKFRWPGQAMLLLLCASICLVAAIQCGFHARQFLYSPADVDDWWPAEDLTVAGRAQRLRDEQNAAFTVWQRWAGYSRNCYNGGIVLFACAAALVIAPPEDAGGAAFRWIGTGVALAAALAEAVVAIRPMSSRRPAGLSS